MPHEINYSNLTGVEKRQAALRDVRAWSDCVNWDNIFAEISGLPPTRESARSISFQFGMFLGISGYPVTAVLGQCWNLTDDEVIEMLRREPMEDDE